MLTLWRWNEQDRLNKYLIYYRSQSGEDRADKDKAFMCE